MLTFRDIKQNYPVYILDRANMTVTNGKVVSGPVPRIDYTTGPNQYKSVIDMKIDVNGKVDEYKQIPEHSSIVDASNNLIIATEMELITREVEAIKTECERYIAEVPRREEQLKKASELLSEINPAFKEKRDIENRFSKIEERFGKIDDTVGRMEKALTDFINKMS